jgi:hypothetical protein
MNHGNPLEPSAHAYVTLHHSSQRAPMARIIMPM